MKRSSFYVIIVIVLITFAGCASMDLGQLPVSGPGRAPSKAAGPAPQAGPSGPAAPKAAAGAPALKTVPALSNNAEIQLEEGAYKGLTITANKVVLTGKGAGKTVIKGDVEIRGNNCIIRNLTIEGNVIIKGNNADLKNARIKGKVESPGKNNSW